MTRREWLKAFAAALGGAAFGLRGARAAEPPVRVGFSVSKTGLFAEAATTQTNAYYLWRDQLNAAGGLNVAGTKRPVEFVTYDDQSSPPQTAKIYEKLITDDKVDLLLSPYGTPNHFAITAILERYQFPMVGSSAASVKLRDLKPGNIWFPTSAMPDRQAKTIADLLVSQGYKSAAVLTVQLPFALELRGFLLPLLKAANINVVSVSDYPADVKDMTPTLAAIKQAAPDAVVGLSFPADSLVYMQQAREIGITAPFQMLSVGPTFDFFIKRFGSNADGLVMMGHWSPHESRWPRAMPFFEAYVAAFHERPEYFDSALAYMSCEITEQAVNRAGLDRAKIREDISTHTFETIDGPVAFKGVENVLTPTMLMQLQGGEAQIVWPLDLATAKFMPKPGWTN